MNAVILPPSSFPRFRADILTRQCLQLESAMKNLKRVALLLVIGALLAGICFARNDDQDDEDQSAVTFLVLENFNGKPLRNAAVVVHPVDKHGRQERNGIELKTNEDGTTHFDGVPYGKMRIQVLATGFQTFGQDFEIDQPAMKITIKLRKPQEQYSIYEPHPGDTNKSPQKSPPPQK